MQSRSNYDTFYRGLFWSVILQFWPGFEFCGIWLMNCKWCGRKRSWPNLRYCVDSCLKWLKEPRQPVRIIFERGTSKTRCAIALSRLSVKMRTRLEYWGDMLDKQPKNQLDRDLNRYFANARQVLVSVQAPFHMNPKTLQCRMLEW
jgi:hypothetical protein